MGKKGVPHRKFSKEEKLRYVEMHLKEKKSIAAIEAECGIRHTLISSWVKKFIEEGEAGLEPKGRNGNPYSALYTSKNLSELDRSRLTVAKQAVEIERLKKGYYVEGVGENKEFVTIKDRNTK